MGKEEERNTPKTARETVTRRFTFIGLSFLCQMGSFIHNNCFSSRPYYVLCITTLMIPPSLIPKEGWLSADLADSKFNHLICLLVGPAFSPSVLPPSVPGHYGETSESWNGNPEVLGLTLSYRGPALRHQEEGGKGGVDQGPAAAGRAALAWKLIRFLVPTRAKSDT